MEMTLSTILWKYMLLALNVALSLLGVCIISFGVVSFGGAGSQTGAYVSTLLGFWIFTICFVGCCASLRESHSLSMIFIGTAVLGIILEVIFIITIAAVKGLMIENMIERVDNVWENADEDREKLNFFQMQYHCCGKEGPEEFEESGENEIPPSCYLNKDNSDPNNLFSGGCLSSARNFIDDQCDYLILALIVCVALEIGSIISAFFLAKSVQNRVVKVEEPIVVNQE